MVREFASASRPDDFSRFEVPLHSPVQASYWSLVGFRIEKGEFVRSQTPENARLIRIFSQERGYDWVRLEEECGQPRRELTH